MSTETMRSIDAALSSRFAGRSRSYPEKVGALSVTLMWALEALERAGLEGEAAEVLARLTGPRGDD
jgi:hypothetical protein